MDQRLMDAATVGDVVALRKIFEEDSLILSKKASLAPFEESPLHVAALAGQINFVKELIKLMPSFATKTNQRGLIPLHMASAEGYVEIVRELLNLELQFNQCLVNDNYGGIPLHYAAINGRVGVIEELVCHCPESIEELTAKGDTVLHLAVKNNQFGAVQELMKRLRKLNKFDHLLRVKDKEGNTFCELAAAKKQFQCLQTLSILKEEGQEKEEFITVEEDCAPQKNDAEITTLPLQPKSEERNDLQNALLVVGGLVITLTYQGVLTPPSSIFKDGTEPSWGCVKHSFGYKSRIKALKNCPAISAFWFLMMNTMIFILSMLLMVRIYSRGRGAFQLRVLTFGLSFIYCILLEAISPYAIYFSGPFMVAFEIYVFIFLDRKTMVQAPGRLLRYICKERR